MDQKLGLNRIVVTRTSDEDDTIVLSGIRTDEGMVTVARIDGERPTFAAGVLLMLRKLGLPVEGRTPRIDVNEPKVLFVGLRISIGEDGEEWTSLETRFADGRKGAAASFAPGFESFAQAAAAMYDR